MVFVDGLNPLIGGLLLFLSAVIFSKTAEAEKSP